MENTGLVILIRKKSNWRRRTYILTLYLSRLLRRFTVVLQNDLLDFSVKESTTVIGALQQTILLTRLIVDVEPYRGDNFELSEYKFGIAHLRPDHKLVFCAFWQIAFVLAT